MKQTVRLQNIYQSYRKDIDFYWIYGQEARASDTGLTPSKDPAPLTSVANHTTAEQRKKTAATCAAAIGFTVPQLIDDMDHSATIAYDAHPTRLYIIGSDGKIAFAGGPGPFQTDLDAFEKALKELASQ